MVFSESNKEKKKILKKKGIQKKVAINESNGNEIVRRMKINVKR